MRTERGACGSIIIFSEVLHCRCGCVRQARNALPECVTTGFSVGAVKLGRFIPEGHEVG